MSAPLLSVCIPTYGRGAVLAARVAAFLRAAASEEIEIVVSDNASPDGTAEAFAGIRDPRLTFIRQESNVGTFENQLRALAAARGTWLLQMTDKDGLRAEVLPAALDALAGLQAGCGGFELHGSSERRAADVTCWTGRAAYARVGLAFAHPSGRFFRADVLRRPGLLDRHRALDAVTRPYSTDYLTSLCLSTGVSYAYVDLPFVQHNLPPYEGVVRSFSYAGCRNSFFTPDFVFVEFLRYVRFMRDDLRLPLSVRLAAIFGTVRRSLLPWMTTIYRSILENRDICAWYGIDDRFRRRELARDLEGEFLSRAESAPDVGGVDALAVRWAIRRCARRLGRAARGAGADRAAAPLVSVLLPAYNHERYVEHAVRSVLDQDWPRVELIVIDDGSTDATWDVLQRMRPLCEARLERVSMERQENCGTCTTLNRLRTRATGEFVTFLASDDAFAPGAFSALVDRMRTDGRLALVVGQNALMDDQGRTCYWDAARNAVHDPAAAAYRTLNEQMAKTSGVAGTHPEFGSYRRLLHQNHIANGALIRRTCLDRVGPWCLQAPLEDWWLVLQLSKVGRMAEIPFPTFRYRWHATNSVRAGDVMAEFYVLNLEEEERRLVQTRDWRHLEIYLDEWGRPDDIRRGFWGTTVRRVTTGFAALRLRQTLGFRKVTRREQSHSRLATDAATPLALMADVRKRGLSDVRLLVRSDRRQAGDEPSRDRLERAFENGTLGLLVSRGGPTPRFAARPLVFHQAFRHRQIAPDMSWDEFLSRLADAARELGREVRIL